MRWLCVHLPLLPLECRGATVGAAPVAVFERRHRRRRLAACNATSVGCGLTPGADVADALALCPELQLFPRAPHLERAALEALAGWAGQFSALVCFDAPRLLLWLEIATNLNYFGGLEPLLSKLHSGLLALGYDASPGVAPTPEAAALLARLGAQPPMTENRLQAQLGKLPVRALAWPEADIVALEACGLCYIGQLLALPPVALARRFGQRRADDLRRLTGALPDPRVPYRPPPHYRRGFELAGWVETSPALLFPLRRLLGELEGFLRGRDAAVCSLKLRFRHEDHQSTELTLHASRPLRSAMDLQVLLRERLERHRLAAPTDRIDLEAGALVVATASQRSLLDDGEVRSARWLELLDQLRARLGDAAVRGLGLRDDHRPERAWRLCRTPRGDDAIPLLERPLWLLEPKPLRTPPAVLGDPERIEAGWWEAADIARDYYRARLPSGSELWVYREHGSRHWYVHGLWA